MSTSHIQSVKHSAATHPEIPETCKPTAKQAGLAVCNIPGQTGLLKAGILFLLTSVAEAGKQYATCFDTSIRHRNCLCANSPPTFNVYLPEPPPQTEDSFVTTVIVCTAAGLLIAAGGIVYAAHHRFQARNQPLSHNITIEESTKPYQINELLPAPPQFLPATKTIEKDEPV